MFQAAPRSTPLFALLLLLAASLVASAAIADDHADATAPTLQLEQATIDPLVFLNGHDLPVLAALAADGVFAPAAMAASESHGISCYTSCYPQFDSFCPPGQVGEALVSGPANDCALADIRCVDSCSGPVLQCRSFSPFC